MIVFILYEYGIDNSCITYTHAYKHTYIHTYIQAVQTWVEAIRATYTHAYKHTYIHTYIQAVQTWVEAIRDAVARLNEERSNPNSHFQ